jgi:hypothetical protein
VLFRSRYKVRDILRLTYNVTEQNDRIIPQNEGYVEFYKKIGNIEEIIHIGQLDTNGNVFYDYKLCDIGENIGFYSKYVNSQNYMENSSYDNIKLITIIEQYNTQIIDNTQIDLTKNYKLGEEINLSYSVKYSLYSNYNNNVDQGKIEFHKINSVDNNIYDEIIFVSNIDDIGSAVFNYKFTNIGQVSFYAKYNNSIDYSNTQSDLITINIIDLYLPNIYDLTEYSNLRIKLGTNITLSYEVKFNNNYLLEGAIEFHKKNILGGLDEIIGYKQLNSVNNGQVDILYTITDLADIVFYGKFVDSVNYSDVSSYNENDLTIINVYKQDQIIITDTSILPLDNYVGSTIKLSYVVSNDNNTPINQGFIEFHKICSDNSDKIIAYIEVINNYTEFTYVLTSPENIGFYGSYIDSKDYESNNSNITNIQVLNRSATINSMIINDNLVNKIFNTIILRYQVIDNISNNPVNIGTVEFHKITINENIINDQILGYIQPDNTGIVNLQYIIKNYHY